VTGGPTERGDRRLISVTAPPADQALRDLESGPLYPFSRWSEAVIPRVAAGVYTIWDVSKFLYVGMSGRSMTAGILTELRAQPRSRGMWTRLNSHASGRRSGDQFCVYVCDRLVLTSLTQEQLLAIAAGTLKLDQVTQDYIRDRLSFRFVEVSSRAEADALERTVRSGALLAGLPFLNPLVPRPANNGAAVRG
jgi:hypothetical protein